MGSLPTQTTSSGGTGPRFVNGLTFAIGPNNATRRGLVEFTIPCTAGGNFTNCICSGRWSIKTSAASQDLYSSPLPIIPPSVSPTQNMERLVQRQKVGSGGAVVNCSEDRKLDKRHHTTRRGMFSTAIRFLLDSTKDSGPGELRVREILLRWPWTGLRRSIPNIYLYASPARHDRAAGNGNTYVSRS